MPCQTIPPPPLLSMCPCVMSPFLSLSAMPISLPDLASAPQDEVRTPCCGVRRNAMWRSVRCTSHPHIPTRLPCLSSVLSALQTPRTSTFSFFFVEITHFDEFRVRGLLVHFGARCVCVPVFLCSHAHWSTCFVLPSPPPPLFCPSLIPFVPHPRISRNLCLLEMCVEMSTRRRVWVSRVQKTLHKYPPPCQNHPSPPPTMRVLFLSDSVEGRRNFAHMIIYWSMKHRRGGRNMIPTCAWPILILRGVSQPTPNAPEVPRTVGVCLDISGLDSRGDQKFFQVPAK